MLKKYLTLLLPLCVLIACRQKQTNLHVSGKLDADTAKKITVAADRLIIPGKSIGTTTINEHMDSVYAKLGRPDDGDAAMGASLSTWYARHNKAGYQTNIYAHYNYDGRHDAISYVKLIRITSPWFKTSAHLNAGLPFSAFAGQYKLSYVAAYTKGTDTLKVYDDAAAGIAFEFDNLKKCAAVIVHIKGDTVASYLSMHPDMQPMDIKR